MAKIEIKKVEERLNHRLLFSVRVSGDTEPMEFPVDIRIRARRLQMKPPSLPRLLPSPKTSRRRRGSGWAL